MPAPHEIVAAPLTVYLADIGTAFPNVDVAPAGDWEILGTEGDRNYDEEGVTVSHAEEVLDFKPAGSTMPVKRFRTGETLEIKLNLADVSPDMYAKVMNDAAVTIGGNDKSFSLFRGDQVNSFAILARGMSGVDNDLNAQFEIPKAFVSVNGEVKWNKGSVAVLPISILAVVHALDGSDDPVYRVQTTDGS